MVDYEEGESFARDIEHAAGEPVLSVVVGEGGWGTRDAKGPLPCNVVLPWAEARAALDYEYDDGYGSAECHAITAWTENYVVFVSTYDGSTAVCRVPRNPVDHEPDMPGGG